MMKASVIGDIYTSRGISSVEIVSRERLLQIVEKALRSLRESALLVD